MAGLTNPKGGARPSVTQVQAVPSYIRAAQANLGADEKRGRQRATSGDAKPFSTADTGVDFMHPLNPISPISPFNPIGVFSGLHSSDSSSGGASCSSDYSSSDTSSSYSSDCGSSSSSSYGSD